MERRFRNMNRRILKENCNNNNGRKLYLLRLLFKNFLNVLSSVHYKQSFGLVWFYGISTIGGYLIPNPLYTCI